MLQAVAKPKKPTTATAPNESPSFAEIGRKAARDAQRAALLGALIEQGWNLSAVGQSLGLGHPSNVLRAIKDVGLLKEYNNAKLAKAAIAASKTS
jgi:transcriptional regulator with GAF, ATPase, and Fis domain